MIFVVASVSFVTTFLLGIIVLEARVVRMAGENWGWGYRRIQGALSNLGHEIARSTIAAILDRHGLEPTPERHRRTTWREFLCRHWELIVAADFFTVEVWPRRGLRGYAILEASQPATRQAVAFRTPLAYARHYGRPYQHSIPIEIC